MLKTVVVSSLERVFPNEVPKGIKGVSGFKNEPVSFQVAFRYNETKVSRIFIDVESDLPVSCYNVGYVPVAHVGGHTPERSHKSDLYPDILYPHSNKSKPVEQYPFFACGDSWYTLWVTVNEKGKTLPAGEHTVTVSLYEGDYSKKPVAVKNVSVNLANAVLPPQRLKYTNWFHCDCLADYYRVEPYSERFFEIFESFVSTAVKNGMNMILLPAFTPALDTKIGSYRKNVQLVKVTKSGKEYGFDFSLMKRYVDICKKCGIKYFEHSHLFTQWGAKNTPAVYAEENGKPKRIFGWETKSSSKEYGRFLKAYFAELKKFLTAEKIEKKILFHVSDEPGENVIESYSDAVNQVKDLIREYDAGDALSDYSFYEKGLVRTPIVITDKLDSYYGKCSDYWAYYTGLQKGSNRFHACEPCENRSTGYIIYHYGAKGFLHWGYNYYYDILSSRLFNPFCETCGHIGSAGTSYCVYPAHDGTALQSMRQKVFYEGLNDFRALEALDKKSGGAAEKLLKKHFGDINFMSVAQSSDKLIKFRKELNALAEK